ncbi:MAG: D-alanyl-lipoteichoic acid biosynthesis protein DltD [Chthoniobacteraceae bacterium]
MNHAPSLTSPVTLPPTRPHLAASLIALALAGFGLVIGLTYCAALEKRAIHALAPEFSDEKLQGAALQKEAFRQPDLLVMYGSSELAKEMPNNAVQFFEDYPTGFCVFPVGKPGTTSLAILQKLAAVGSDARGRKLAYSISPGWFFTEDWDPIYYEGNFSDMQAMELVFSSDLSRGLRHDVARRMIEYPRTADDSWVLDFSAHRLAGDTLGDRVAYNVIWPLGKLQCAIGRMQDHFSAALYILDEDEKLDSPARRSSRGLNWNVILRKAARFANKAAVRAKQNEVALRHGQKSGRPMAIQRGLAQGEEWTDFELLLRTCQELGANPLFLSMPIEDIRLEVYGLGDDARRLYVERLRSLTDEFQFPLLLFQDHESDLDFLVDFQDHLSGEGWLYYNKALDDFYHGRISSL